jgi:hypothetical protein
MRCLWILPLLPALLWVPAASAQVKSDDALARYRKLTSVVSGCGARPRADDIIVCGQRDDIMHSQRLPYPEERKEPGARPSLVPGEVPSFSNKVPCPPRGCPGGGSIIGGIGKIIGRIRD